MCRIISLILLQRLKESLSGDPRDFNNTEARAVIKVSLQGKVPKEIHVLLVEILGKYTPSYATVKNNLSKY
jgi:hypothetical protein